MPNLAVIEKYAFVNLPKLKILEMKNNKNLVHFGTKAFGNSVQSLQYLYLTNSAIEVFPETIMRNGDVLNFQLEKLDISGNPLSCDCHLNWIKKLPEVIGDPKADIEII